MKNIEVKKIIQAIETSDGAGVKLKRSIGTPEADYIDPFLMLDEFGSENKDDYIAGFPPHPHRGIETVTYMLKGDFEHEDSTGAKGIMSSGDVQWMKTGRGIIHSEMPAMSGGKLLGFQLWVNMNSGERAGENAIAVEVEKDKSYYWCSCGKSAKQPFCDGSHKGTDFTPLAYKAEETKKMFFCACKQTNNQPFCDGSHNKK